MDYVIDEFIYMLLSDMNLRIGKVKNYNNKILISSPSFKIGTNLKVNLDGKKNEPDVKPKGEEIMKTKPNIEPNKEHKQDYNLTLSSIKKASLIRIRSPMRKKRLVWYWE